MLSLDKYRDRLVEQRGYKLNAKPREIDIRIIDQDYDGADRMDNAIAHLFERHNLVELKDPYENLDIDVIWKGISYAAQYKSSGYDDTCKKSGVDAVPMSDVTLTFLRASKPRKLFGLLASYGYGVRQEFPGVYYIKGMADIKMQVVVGRELRGEEFAPIRVQRKNADDRDVRIFTELIEKLSDSHSRELADSVMQVSIMENKGLYDRLMEEEPIMCKALRELMNDQIEREKSEAVSKAVIDTANATQEKIAKRMIEKKRPFEEIFEFTSVPIERLRELADMLAGAPTKAV